MVIKQDIPALLVGIMSTMVSIGLARFSYTPLLPELIRQDWFSAHQAVYLGASNLLGYFIGAIAAHQISERVRLRVLMNICFVAVLLSFIGCALPLSFEWFFTWRLIAGIAGAILMVVGPASVIALIPVERRASVGTLMFTGIGIGALLAATVIPLLVQASLMITWMVLAIMTLIAAWVNDVNLVKLQDFRPIGLTRKHVTAPDSQPRSDSPTRSDASKPVTHFSLVVLFVLIAYGFDALGFIPHTIFWADFLAREQGLGTSVASFQWALFGAGAMCGPFIARYGAQNFGWSKTLSTAFLAKAIAIMLPVLFIQYSSLDLIKYSISSFIVGAMVPGIVSLTSGRIAELVGPLQHKKYWGWATAIFALAQAVSGYAMSGLYGYFESYHWLFFIASGLMSIGLVLSLLSAYVSAKREIKVSVSKY